MKRFYWVLVISTMLVMPLSGVHAEPERKIDVMGKGHSRAAKKSGAKKSIKKRRIQTRKKQRGARGQSRKQEKNSRGRSGRKADKTRAGACNLKPSSLASALPIDPEVSALFERIQVIDGSLIPSEYSTCCISQADKADCDPADTEDPPKSKHVCYNSKSPSKYTEITTKMGVNVGSSGFSSTSGDYYQKRAQDGAKIRVIRTGNDLDKARWTGEYGNIMYLQSWKDEHADLTPTALAQMLYEQGARIVQIAYNRKNNNDVLTTPFAGGANQDRMDLSESGVALVDALLDRYILVDVSHVGDTSARQIIAQAKERNRIVTANHANARTIFDDRKNSTACGDGCTSRNHADETICQLAAAGGVLGITPIRFMFAGVSGSTYHQATENDFIEHLDYVAKGLRCTVSKRKSIDMTHHVGVASDSKINGYHADVQWLHMPFGSRLNRWMRVASRLKNECGYSLIELGRIFGGNFQRVYRASLPGIQKPKTKAPKYGATLRSKVVRFAWKRPVINRPKGSRSMQFAKPSTFNVVIQKRRGGRYKAHKKVKVVNKTSKRIRLGSGTYRWYVQAKNLLIKVNSEWQTFSIR